MDSTLISTPPKEDTPSLTRARRAAFGSFAGAVVDWYDFLLYGITAALVFNSEFFPQISPAMGTLAAFATFGVGFLFRPLGGVIFGHFGDRLGRKRMLMLTVWMMGIATALIGILPSFAAIGWWAPVLLVTLRAIQGFAVGGEWGGAALLSVESAPENKKAFYSSGVQVGYGVGLLLSTGLTRHFPTTELAQIGDETADGIYHPAEFSPLSHFDARRVDFSLARLRHYTGTPVEHFQPFVLFTNYTRYVDEFVRWGCSQILDPDSPYIALSCAGGIWITAETEAPEEAISDLAWKKHQMPAWHLITADGQGITLVNIGVGPSNAKTICDHLAVLRPDVWLMIGHCGGLRESQMIGDYVLAHAYLRDDHVLDAVLPPDIPIPSIAEVQRALYDATKLVSGMPGEEVKQRLRTGTVVTTDDRNWELRYSASALRFNLSRAVAIDMESATIAAQGYRFRVPYGTLLCVSDKPLHGEIKLPGQANRFYEGAISEHLQIGIRAIDLLRAEGERLHSRKLRTFNEPPFR